MALEGTLDTVSLPEVLHLLAAGKTGRLQLDGPGGSGSILVRGGRVAAAETPRTGMVAAADDVAEAVFELLRWEAGSFAFSPAEGPDDGAEQAAGSTVDEVLAEASARLDRWRAVEAVVPSPTCAVDVVEELEGESATVSAGSWPVLVAAARSATVAEVGSRLSLDEVAASGAVRELVDAGLARVGETSATEEAATTAAPAPTARNEDDGDHDGGVALLRRLTGSTWTWVDDGAGGRKLERVAGPPPDWALEGAVAATPGVRVSTRPVGDEPPAPRAEPRIPGGPDWADDEALDQAFAGWTPGPSPEAHPLERALVLPGPDAPEPTTMGEHKLLERLLGTLRA